MPLEPRKFKPSKIFFCFKSYFFSGSVSIKFSQKSQISLILQKFQFTKYTFLRRWFLSCAETFCYFGHMKQNLKFSLTLTPPILDSPKPSLPISFNKPPSSLPKGFDFSPPIQTSSQLAKETSTSTLVNLDGSLDSNPMAEIKDLPEDSPVFKAAGK